jgi:hypothetical protein
MKYLESFFWGILAALGALLTEFIILNILQITAFSKNIMNIELFFSSLPFIAIAATTEEIFKYIVIAKKIEDFFIERSIIFGSFLIGLSFCVVEVALIYTQIDRQSLMHFPNLRYVIEICILHLSTAGIIGYFIATSNPAKISTLIKAILCTVSIHFIFNLLALHRGYVVNYLIFILLLFLAAINILNTLRIHKKLAS